MQRSAKQLDQLLKDNKIVFVRSGVGNGKTTLANYLAKNPTFHLVDVPRDLDASGRYDAVVAAIVVIASAMSTDVPDPAVRGLMSVLELLGDAGHVLVFDEAHLLFSVTRLCDVLFKDPVCRVLLFSASSERAAGPQDEPGVTPGTIAKFMWYPRAPSQKEVATMVAGLTGIGIGIDKPTFSVLYMISGGNRDIFMHALRWLQEQSIHSDEALARVRLGLVPPWSAPAGLLPALKQSRAVRANRGYENARNVPQLLVKILAGGPQSIVNDNLRRPLTISGLIVPYVASADLTAEFFTYDWGDAAQLYTVSSTLRAAFYGSTLKAVPFSMTCEWDHPTDVTTCAELCARAFPLMVFPEVVQRPAVDDDGGLSLASAIRTCGLAPEDDYNAAFQRALKVQEFDARDYKSAADGGKIDHHVWVDPSAVRPVWGLEFEHFGDPSKRKEHAHRFTKEGMETYRMAKLNALVVLCSTQRQVDIVMREALKDATFRPHGVDVIAQLVSTSHESYTMTVLPAGAVNPLPPVVLQCDGVAKTIVAMDDGSLVLKSAQHLGSISGMKYQEEEAVRMETAGPAAVVISVQLGAAGAAGALEDVVIHPRTPSAAIEGAIKVAVGIPDASRIRLRDSDRRVVAISDALPSGMYTVEEV
mmetsp:Transcript_31891/g.83563  ORF Transcript_31891/g.83563 Transcript_31891/m.83563 type:complete len:645 (-) Transcript_31891:52-1986(-)